MPSVPCFRDKQACACSAWVGSRLPTALLFVPSALQPARGSHLLGVPSMGLEPLTPQGGSLSGLLWVPSQGTSPGLITAPLFLPDSLWLSYSCGCAGVFSLSPAGFQWALFRLWCSFDVLVGRDEFPTLLLCHTDLFWTLWAGLYLFFPSRRGKDVHQWLLARPRILSKLFNHLCLLDFQFVSSAQLDWLVWVFCFFYES